jgi:hypothetical protein
MASVPAATASNGVANRATCGVEIIHGDDDQIVPIDASAMISSTGDRAQLFRKYRSHSLWLVTVQRDWYWYAAAPYGAGSYT